MFLYQPSDVRGGANSFRRVLRLWVDATGRELERLKKTLAEFAQASVHYCKMLSI
jgi:hypothetical protein